MVSWLPVPKCNALSKITRILIIVLVCHLAGCAAGSCISYGHSCWGAHGKRSGDSQNLAKAMLEARAYQRPPNVYEMIFSRLENKQGNEARQFPLQIHNLDKKDKNWKREDFIRSRNKDDRSLKLLLNQL